MQQKGKFKITSQDPWSCRFGTRKYQKSCLARNNKSNFTTIFREAIISFLLV